VTAGTAIADVGPRDHAVQFYRHEEELAAKVAEFLLPAVAGGGVAVVIATPPHRLAFEDALAESGVDVPAACASGAYISLDAATVMSGFLTDASLDYVAFEAVVGGLVQAAGEDGRPVRAYGEMVALLWDAGRVPAALELEAAWNDLAGRQPFALLCGYPAEAVTGDAHHEAFGEVCRLHSCVVGQAPREAAVATRAFGSSPDSAVAARHFAEETLRSWDASDEVTDDTVIAVAELAANAIVHAQSAFVVRLAAQGDVLRVSVRDTTPVRGHPETVLPAAHGHGLGVVAALSTRWGTEPLGAEGKLVWAELAAPMGTPSPATQTTAPTANGTGR
jgi:hypothetical protein